LNLAPWYFQYLLRKRNNTLTKQDRVREEYYHLNPKTLTNTKQNPEAMTKVDEFIKKFILLYKRQTNKEIVSVLDEKELNADKVISWLAA